MSPGNHLTPARVMRGFADGTLATVPMSAFMLAAQRLGAMGRQPPARITDAALRAAGAHRTPSPLRKAAATALHFGFGGVAGALFSALTSGRRGTEPRWSGSSPRAGRRHLRRSVLAGLAFGSGVWAASYMGWVPALGIMPPAHRDRPGRPWSMILAHWIYGATLGWRTAAAG